MKKFINVKYEVITLFRTLEHYHVLAIFFFFNFLKNDPFLAVNAFAGVTKLKLFCGF